MPEKLTVLIPAKNEHRNIRLCVEAARAIADEVLVADSGSTDGTQEIARSLGCRVIERELIDFSNFKNWAIAQAKHNWVLIVDADERVTPELAAEIRQVLADPPASIDAYWIYRDNHFLGHRLRWGDHINDRVQRLLRREIRYTNRRVHEHLDVQPDRQGTLKARLVHYMSWTYDQHLAKTIHYSRLSALDMRDRGRHAGFWGTILRPPFRFVQLYVFRGGFLDGMPGLHMALLVAFKAFLKQARLWELEHAIAQPDPEAERKANGEKKAA